MAHLLQILVRTLQRTPICSQALTKRYRQTQEVDNVLVIVTRYFGGIHLGPDRFKHINQAARNALELGGFLDVPDDSHAGRRHGKGKGSAVKR